MRLAMRLACALACLVLFMSAASAQVKPEPGPGGSGRNPETKPQPGTGTGTSKDDPSKATPSGPTVREPERPAVKTSISKADLDRLWLDGVKLLQDLDRILQKAELDGEELSGEWALAGMLGLASWRADAARIREFASKPAGKAALKRLKVGWLSVSLEVWIQAHDRFLDNVVNRGGSGLARLKGDMNERLADIKVQSGAVSLYVGFLVGDMSVAAVNIDNARTWILGAGTYVHLEYAQDLLDRSRILVRKVRNFLKGRSVLARMFFETTDPELLTERLAESSARLASEEAVKGVDAEWKKLTADWTVRLNEEIDEYEQDWIEAVERWAGFVKGDFYRTGRTFKDLDPDELEQPIDEMEKLIPIYRKRVDMIFDVGKEISAAEKIARKLQKTLLGEAKSVDTKPYDRLREMALGAEGELKDRLLKMAERISPDKERELLGNLADRMTEASGESFKGLLADLTAAPSDDSARTRIKNRFKAMMDGRNKDIAVLKELLKDLRYDKKVLIEEAIELRAKMGY